MRALSAAILLLAAVPAPHLLLAQQPRDAVATWPEAPRGFLERYCADCHADGSAKGNFRLEALLGGAGLEDSSVPWLHALLRVRDRVASAEMPPPDAEAPTPAERAELTAWVEVVLARAVPVLPADPGRPVVRRLSRNEWERTVAGLFGVVVPIGEKVPPDDLGYGFDNIGAALSFSTLHLEGWLDASAIVAERVFDGIDPANPPVRRFTAAEMQLVGGPGIGAQGDVANFYTAAEIEQSFRVPRDGTYRIEWDAGADPAGTDPARLRVRLDGRDLDVFDVDWRVLRMQSITLPINAGEHALRLAFINDFYDPDNPDPKRRDRNLRLGQVRIHGPLDTVPAPPQRAWLDAALAAKGTPAARFRSLVRALLLRAWRRPPADDEVRRLVALAEATLREEGSEVAAQRTVLQAVLVSPHFLFRIEPTGPGGTLPAHALATRLSYFLWASAPDEPLLMLAARGTLQQHDVLSAQVDRMLADERGEALATSFAAQWLELRALADRTPDATRFPGFDRLRGSFRRETELLFLAVLREDRDVRELLDAPFTHVDAALADFYGLPVPAEQGFHRVELPSSQGMRRGILGHASIHALTSNPTRTSPVKRGKWILENLLGAAPPPPPPGNDTLAAEEKVDSTKSFREQLAIHRQRSECAVCHVRMDALGFALEEFDAIGRHRTADAAGPIDATAILPDGRAVQGVEGLRALVRDDPAFVRTLLARLFVHAVGRELRPRDSLDLDRVAARLAAQPRVTLRDLVQAVVAMPAFRMRSGT